MTGLLDHGSLKFLDLLSPTVKAALAAVEHRQTYQDGRTIFSTGDEGDRLLIVRSGAVRMGRLSPSGRETILAVLGEGHFIGIMGVLTGRKRTQIATAIGKTTIGYVLKADFLTLMDAYPEIARAALPATLSRLNVALNMLDDLRLLPLPAYTAVFLQNMLEASEVPGMLNWNQSELAIAVGTSRVSMGKALKQLENNGLIVLKYGAIAVPDEQALSDWIDAARAEHLSL
ncbi:cAMP receptor protein [Pseudovibrio sp. Ad13]|uniref:Crp/Fnr family transcriptional regulator n=1 Tax=Pseudovibrio sp. Ad13 TaxID=989396 RepID=UPI0007AE8062|nr:Crp/Fnr family transcriptional regulator [Pseudovibrio sp. Ad13]KZK77494.1 cAMP receptor protein [Pseudovibrio sp. Ad13]